MAKDKALSVAQRTETYIRDHPSIKECLRLGIVNHTALARRICKAEGISSVDAVVMASARYGAKIGKTKSHEAELRQMLASAKILVRSKVLLAAWDRERNFNNLLVLHDRIRKRDGEITIVEGHKLITIFTENEFAPEIKRVVGSALKFIKLDLVKITLLLPEKVTFTHGYAAFMFNLISGKGINMLGDVTSTAEHIFVIEEKDLEGALSALKITHNDR